MLTVLKVRTLEQSHLVSTTRMSIATFHFNFASIRWHWQFIEKLKKSLCYKWVILFWWASTEWHETWNKCSYGPPSYTHRIVSFQTPYFSNSDPFCKKWSKIRTDFKMLTVLKVRTLDWSHLVSITRRSIATFHLNFVSIRWHWLFIENQ